MMPCLCPLRCFMLFVLCCWVQRHSWHNQLQWLSPFREIRRPACLTSWIRTSRTAVSSVFLSCRPTCHLPAFLSIYHNQIVKQFLAAHVFVHCCAGTCTCPTHLVDDVHLVVAATTLTCSCSFPLAITTTFTCHGSLYYCCCDIMSDIM